jgi:succinylglutamate desuccinylase
MKINKIFVVACTHGDEVFGLKVLAHLQTLGSRNKILCQIAHPEAIAKKKRYIETDLNRSFKLPASASAEAGIAQRLIEDINRCDPDLILDLHTSTVGVGQVAILAENNPLVISASKRLGLKHAAVMPKKIVEKSLIGAFPEKSICIELGSRHRSDVLAKNLASMINGLLNQQLPEPDHIMSLFLIERIIEHLEAPETELNNYEFNENLGGYPFLTGKSNYKEHRGFLATSQIEV